MKVIVIGGGKVGFYLAKNLVNRKHDVTLIEKDKNLCNEISNKINIDIIHGDGTDLDVLKDAEIDIADVIVAATGKDEENLVICEVVKENFNIKQIISRINNPKNKEVFKMLSVDKTVCSTEVISNLIDWEFENEQIRILQIFERGNMVLVEIYIDKNITWCNKSIKDLNMPFDFVIVYIYRDSKVIYPKGDLLLEEDDKIVIATDSKNIKSKSQFIYSKLEEALFV
ncbi:potassium channel family protein [[Clostridium] dakarense]|uniref:potassium channel family protein n=1 Tax=Faecalimicrobium dakarense TaxID=1301100 RepID=UPI0004B5BADB|nr:TrkA family potassium uptake protein [[Clostridium] dakarense]